MMPRSSYTLLYFRHSVTKLRRQACFRIQSISRWMEEAEWGVKRMSSFEMHVQYLSCVFTPIFLHNNICVVMPCVLDRRVGRCFWRHVRPVLYCIPGKALTIFGGEPASGYMLSILWSRGVRGVRGGGEQKSSFCFTLRPTRCHVMFFPTWTCHRAKKILIDWTFSRGMGKGLHHRDLFAGHDRCSWDRGIAESHAFVCLAQKISSQE